MASSPSAARVVSVTTRARTAIIDLAVFEIVQREMERRTREAGDTVV